MALVLCTYWIPNLCKKILDVFGQKKDCYDKSKDIGLALLLVIFVEIHKKQIQNTLLYLVKSSIGSEKNLYITESIVIHVHVIHVLSISKFCVNLYNLLPRIVKSLSSYSFFFYLLISVITQYGQFNCSQVGSD